GGGSGAAAAGRPQAAGPHRLGSRGRLMIGLELQEARAVAVSVSGTGEIAARAIVESAADLGAAAQSALDQVGGGAPDATLGVASGLPESFAVTPVLERLARRVPGPYAQSAPTPSGTAAAVAEAWIGAGKAVQDLVYFSVAEHTTGGI